MPVEKDTFIEAKGKLHYVLRYEKGRAKYIKELRALKKKYNKINMDNAGKIMFPDRAAFADAKPREKGRFVGNPNKKKILKTYSQRGRPSRESSKLNEFLQNVLSHSQELLNLLSEIIKEPNILLPNVPLPASHPIDVSDPESTFGDFLQSFNLDQQTYNEDLSKYVSEDRDQNLTPEPLVLSTSLPAAPAPLDLDDGELSYLYFLNKQSDEDTLKPQCETLTELPYNFQSGSIREEENFIAESSDSTFLIKHTYALGRFGVFSFQPNLDNDNIPSLATNPFKERTFG